MLNYSYVCFNDLYGKTLRNDRFLRCAVLRGKLNRGTLPISIICCLHCSFRCEIYIKRSNMSIISYRNSITENLPIIFVCSFSVCSCVLNMPNCTFTPIGKSRLALDNMQRMRLHMPIPSVPLFNGEENDFYREIMRYF